MWKRRNEIGEHFVHAKVSSVTETEDGNMLQRLPSGTTARWSILHIQNAGQDVNVDFPVAMIYVPILVRCPSPLSSRETRTSSRKVLITEA